MPLVVPDLSSLSSALAAQAQSSPEQASISSGSAALKSSEVTLDTLRQLDPATLNGEIDRVAHSISHLERSNAEIQKLLDAASETSSKSQMAEDALDEDDEKELQIAIEENEGTM